MLWNLLLILDADQDGPIDHTLRCRHRYVETIPSDPAGFQVVADRPFGHLAGCACVIDCHHPQFGHLFE